MKIEVLFINKAGVDEIIVNFMVVGIYVDNVNVFISEHNQWDTDKKSQTLNGINFINTV